MSRPPAKRRRASTSRAKDLRRRKPDTRDDGTPSSRRWHVAWRVFSDAIGIVGAVTGIIAVLALVLRNTTDLDSLEVSYRPIPSELVPTFAVPIDADWSTFPEAPNPCSPEQLRWLEAVGTRLNERFLVTVVNMAEEGQTLSLKDFRGNGESTATQASAIAVVCDRTGGAGSGQLRAARVNPATGRIAVWEQGAQSDSPLVPELAPGERLDFALLVHSSADFDGDIVFSSHVGDDSREVVLIPDISLPALAPNRLIVTSGGVACFSATECDLDQGMSELVFGEEAG